MAFLKNGFPSIEQELFPNIVNICVFKGECPASCVHCPVGLEKTENRKSVFGYENMSLELYKSIVDELVLYPHSTLRLHSVGEPLLWKNLIPSIQYSYKKNVRTWIFTCGITDNHDVLSKIVQNCNIVEVSVNSYDKENYLNTKGVNAFDIVKRNIEFMAKQISDNNLKTRLIVSRVESTDKNYDEEFKKYWKSSNLVADAFIRSYHSYNSLIADRQKNSVTNICLVHWGRFNIDTNGDAVVCFNELFKGHKMDKSLILGNLQEENIYKIWHGEKLNIIRQSELTNNPAIVDFTDNLPCENCNYCQPLFSKSEKSEKQINSCNKTSKC